MLGFMIINSILGLVLVIMLWVGELIEPFKKCETQKDYLKACSALLFSTIIGIVGLIVLGLFYLLFLALAKFEVFLIKFKNLPWDKK